MCPELTNDLLHGQHYAKIIGKPGRSQNRARKYVHLATVLWWTAVAFAEETSMDTPMIGQRVVVVFV